MPRTKPAALTPDPAPKKRRAKGTGSYSYDPVKRLYRVRFPAPDSEAPIDEYVRTEAEAVALLDRLVRDRDARALGRHRLTLRQWAVEWLADQVLPNRTRGTYTTYSSRLENHVLPTLGDVRMADLDGDPRRIRALYAKLRRDGTTPAMVAAVHAALRRCLRAAERELVISRSPCGLVELPARPKFQRRPLSVEQVRVLLAAIRGHPNEHLWRFLLWTAARYGEAAGLAPDQVDEAGSLVTFSWQISYVLPAFRAPEHPDLWWERTPPKTEESAEPVPLSLPALAALREQRAEVMRLRTAAGDRWQRLRLRTARDDGFHELGLVFPGADGGPLRENTMMRRWRAALRSAGLPEETRMHDLRHSAAELALDAGADLPSVQRLLRHKSIQTTNDIYAGRLSHATRRATNLLADTVEGSSDRAPDAAPGAETGA